MSYVVNRGNNMLKQLLSKIKKIHIHKYETLLIYPPHSQVCNLPQCQSANDYGFLIQCHCGHYKLTKLPYSIKEILFVKPEIK